MVVVAANVSQLIDLPQHINVHYDRLQTNDCTHRGG
jgi:hypothetical protein